MNINIMKSMKSRLWRMQRIVRSRLGVGSKMESPDRLYQEDVLIPNALKSSGGRNILYVGVAWYTYHYYKKFFGAFNLTSLDISRDQAVYGSRRHIVGGLDSPDLRAYTPFDVIFMLGILNYGINDGMTFKDALLQLEGMMSEDGVCYLTIEEGKGYAEKKHIDSSEMIRLAETANFHIAPISNWFQIMGSGAKTRFYVMSRSKPRLDRTCLLMHSG